MIVLQIEHKVSNYDEWKKAFESDPINRKKLGVCRYTISQPVDDLNYIIIELEFKEQKNAEDALIALRTLWGNVEGKLMFNPKTRITNIIETIEV